jgi:sulfur carrier protein
VIEVNGSPSDVPAGATVADLLATLDVPDGARGIAVAVDAEVVPRAEWPGFALADGARVEILTAVQGG